MTGISGRETGRRYATLSDALTRAGVVSGASELHGSLCGLLCSSGVDAAQHWLQQNLLAQTSEPSDSDALREALHGFVAESWHTLSAGQMSFDPLLPDDERPLAERVQALADWCQGFLAGLGLGGLHAEALGAAKADSVAEIFTDFTEISRAALEAEASGDPNEPEFALAEVTEYVRVSVQIVFEELGALRAARGQRTLH